MNLLARIQLGSELDLLISELASGSLSMIEKIKKAGRLDEVVTLLTGEAGDTPAASAVAEKTLTQLLKDHAKIMVRVVKDKRFSVLFKRYHTELNRSNRSAGIEFEKEMSFDVAEEVSGKSGDSIRLHKQLEKDLTDGVLLIRQGKYIAIEPYLTPRNRKTPQVAEFLNWLYQNDFLLTGEKAKPDYNGKGEEINDRNHFTVERVENDRMVNITFERGEKIKIPQGKGSFKLATITGISQTDQTFKADGGDYAYNWGFAYKLTYDMAESVRDDLERDVRNYENTSVVMNIDYNRIVDKYIQYDKELNYELDDAVERLKAAHILRLEKQKQDQAELEARQQAAKDYQDTQAQKEKDAAQKILDALPEYEEMTMDQWKRTSKDFKHIDNGQRYVLRNIAGLGTRSRPVKIIKEVAPEDTPLPDAKTLETEANADFEAEAMEQGAEGDNPIDEAGVFYQSVIDGAEVDASLIETAIGFAQNDESHYLLPQASEAIKNSVLKMAEAM